MGCATEKLETSRALYRGAARRNWSPTGAEDSVNASVSANETIQIRKEASDLASAMLQRLSHL